MGMFDILHKISYQRGLVDKDTILDLMSQVEKFPKEEYGDYGEVLERTDYCIYTEIADVVINADVVDAIPKSDYEARLKADMVAMLADLSMKIGEIEDGYTEFDEDNKKSLTMIPLESVERLIDREINSLKGEGEK